MPRADAQAPPVKLPTFDVFEPASVDEALALLGQRAAAARPIAGGTALMLLMKYGFFHPEVLVSLRRLAPELGGIGQGKGGDLRIGASTTLRQLERSSQVASWVPMLVDAVHHLANVRVRNVATLGGHLAHGDPHMDLPPVLMAVDARVCAASVRGLRWIPVADLYQGYYETALADDELLTEVAIPLARRATPGTYLRFTSLSVDDWPTLGVAVSGVPGSPHMNDVRVAVSAVGDRVRRVGAAETVLEGERPSSALLQHAAEVAASDLLGDDRGSHLGKLVTVQVRRALAATFSTTAKAGA